MGRELDNSRSEIFRILSNPSRLRILELLGDGEMTVSEIVDLTKLNQTNVSQNLAIFRLKGWVRTRKDGRNTYYQLSNPKISGAVNIIKEAADIISER